MPFFGLGSVGVGVGIDLPLNMFVVYKSIYIIEKSLNFHLCSVYHNRACSSCINNQYPLKLYICALNFGTNIIQFYETSFIAVTS